MKGNQQDYQRVGVKPIKTV